MAELLRRGDAGTEGGSHERLYVSVLVGGMRQWDELLSQWIVYVNLMTFLVAALKEADPTSDPQSCVFKRMRGCAESKLVQDCGQN